MQSIKFQPPVIAHRGASKFAPENTLPAFLKAKALGARWVEFDVMLAACGEAVVIHDETLDRTTNGKGNVCDHPYSYIKTLDAGSWFDAVFAGAHVPSFAEVIRLLHQQGLSANVEIKAVEGQEEKTVQKILHEIERHWAADQAPPLISSFSETILRMVRQHAPNALLAFLMDEWMADWRVICDALHCVSVNVNHLILNAERVSEIKATNRYLLSYTVNESQRAQTLFSYGVDAVFSDDVREISE
jgi:glycerophosphoryl diester phosphodiesterase